MAENNTFEIGLVMAGAVSAGAYSAGVVDYLLEALLHYEKIRASFAEEHPGESLHNVQIKVSAGASAGGMTGTMLLSSMTDSRYAPLRGYDPKSITREEIDANLFYRSWVDAKEGIDISYLLDTADVTGKKPLLSLLNCRRLEQIADAALCHPRELQKHDYIPKRIEHFVSVFNMSGVPYTVGFEGSSEQYGMVNHSDMMHFVLDSDTHAKFRANEIPLSQDAGSQLDAQWLLLRQSTLATGAFPLALEPRELSKKTKGYDEWKWWVPQSDSKGRCKDKGRCFSLQQIKPQWSGEKPEEYTFVSVDGGVANNEPLEVARRMLAGEEKFNPRDKNSAKRAVFMVDPFPSEPFRNDFEMKGLTLFKSAARLFGNLKQQSRFKPDELEMARNPDIFSRFLIAPSRAGAPRGEEIASASLGAFGGFLSEKFRQHDFQLGRKNCQSFLTSHFVIGIDNPLVQRHAKWFEEKGCVVTDKAGEKFVQVVPMVDSEDEKITEPIVPIPYESIAMTQSELGTLMKQIDRRIETVLERSYIINTAIDEITKKIDFPGAGWLANKVLKLFKNAIASYIVSQASGKIRKIIVADLSARKLLK